VRADLLRRLGRMAEAALAYDAAIARCENAAERGFLERRRRGLSDA
jgi:RNA polymerase sigma-70 factor (ECF subfamily)